MTASCLPEKRDEKEGTKDNVFLAKKTDPGSATDPPNRRGKMGRTGKTRKTVGVGKKDINKTTDGS